MSAHPQIVVGLNAVILAVKPQLAKKVLTEDGVPDALENTLVVSICAGVTLEQLSSCVPKETVCRAMPNTPSLIGAGMTALCAGRWASDSQVDAARRVFAGMGRTLVLEESYFDAVTGLSASRVAASIGNAAFLAPATRTSPASGIPPLMISLSIESLSHRPAQPVLLGGKPRMI